MDRWRTALPMMGLLIGCTLMVAARPEPSRVPTPPPEPQQAEVQTSDIRVTPVVRAVEKVADSVVNIYSNVDLRAPTLFESGGFRFSQRNPSSSLGSGVIISRDGYVVTNVHVLTGLADIEDVDRVAIKVRTRWSDDSMAARVVSWDRANDLALLKIASPGPFPVAQIGRSDDLMIGETIIAVGNPYGYENSVTMGIISGTGKTLTLSTGQEFRDFVQIDAALNFGNSGGPLFNIKGELIGINQLIAADPQRRGTRAEAIGLTIPIDRVRGALIRSLLNPALRKLYYGMSIGVDASMRGMVTDVDRDGPAQQAGIRKGDVVVAVDGEETLRGLDLAFALYKHQPGDTLSLEIARGERLVQVPLAAHEYMPSSGNVIWNKLGVRVDDDPVFKGAVVTEVRPGGPADALGILPNDLLVSIASVDISTAIDLRRLTKQLPEGVDVEVNLFRFKARRLNAPIYDQLSGDIRVEAD